MWVIRFFCGVGLTYQGEVKLRSQEDRSYSEDLSSLQFRHAVTVSRPDQFLAVTDNSGLSVEITHAATLTSDQLLQGGSIRPEVTDYLQELAQAGINALYVPGIYQSAKFSQLIMPFFASSWNPAPNLDYVGPSVFSIDDYQPRAQIGSWDNFARLSETVRKSGHQLVIDFVPNTIGVGSLVARNHPEFLRDFPGPKDELPYLQKLIADDGVTCLYYRNELESKSVSHHVSVLQVNGGDEVFVYRRMVSENTSDTIILQRNSRGFLPYAWLIAEDSSGHQTVHCKQLGTDGGTVWADVFMLATESLAVKKWHASVLAQLASKVDIVRIDMAHLPDSNYYFDLRDIILDNGWKMPILWGEAYGCGAHDALAYRGVTTYASFIRNWLRQDPPNISALKWALYEDSTAAKFFGRNYSIAYTANHDDSHDRPSPKEGALAAIVCSLPVPIVMWAQGQRYGDPHRYGADQHVPLHEYQHNISRAQQSDPQYAEFMRRLSLLARAPVFRSRYSSWHPVYFADTRGKDDSAIFHISRSWRNSSISESSDDGAILSNYHAPVERVFAVIDCQPYQPNGRIVIDLAKTCRVDPDSLDNYLLVNLINGEVSPAVNFYELRPPQRGVGYDAHIYTLFPKKLYEHRLRLEDDLVSANLLSQAQNEILSARI